MLILKYFTWMSDKRWRISLRDKFLVHSYLGRKTVKTSCCVYRKVVEEPSIIVQGILGINRKGHKLTLYLVIWQSQGGKVQILPFGPELGIQSPLTLFDNVTQNGSLINTLTCVMTRQNYVSIHHSLLKYFPEKCQSQTETIIRSPAALLLQFLEQHSCQGSCPYRNSWPLFIF